MEQFPWRCLTQSIPLPPPRLQGLLGHRHPLLLTLMTFDLWVSANFQALRLMC